MECALLRRLLCFTLYRRCHQLFVRMVCWGTTVMNEGRVLSRIGGWGGGGGIFNHSLAAPPPLFEHHDKMMLYPMASHVCLFCCIILNRMRGCLVNKGVVRDNKWKCTCGFKPKCRIRHPELRDFLDRLKRRSKGEEGCDSFWYS